MMIKLKAISISFIIFVFITGCSSGDWNNPTGNTSDPRIISVIPPRGADGVSTSENIVAYFNKDLDPSTVHMGNFYVYNYDDYVSATVGTTIDGVTTYGSMPLKIDGNYSYDSGQKAAIFSPRYLNPEAPYIAILTTGIKASDGRSMLTGYSWTFSTKSQSRSSMP